MGWSDDNPGVRANFVCLAFQVFCNILINFHSQRKYEGIGIVAVKIINQFS